MRTVRRLYFYILSLIGSQAVVWGAVSLLRNIIDEGLAGTVSSLATGLSLVLVGLPVFLLHWLTAQRDAMREEEEHISRIRAVFFYVVRVWTLIPIVYSLLALLNRLIAALMGLSDAGVLFGSGQTTSDNLISIVINLAVFLYFSRVLREDWRTAPAGHFLAEARRLYRYLWMLFGLTVSVFAVQGMLSYLFSIPQGMGNAAAYQLANSLALAVVGAPIWSYTWILLQDALDEPAEAQSILRLLVLYIISLAGVVGVLASGGRVLSGLFALILGRPQTLSEFLSDTGPALAALVPLAVMWAYFGQILEREMAAMANQPRRAGVRRLYRALLSALGLATTFAALVTLISYVAEGVLSLRGIAPVWGQVNSGLAALATGLPLWLATWTPIQSEAAARGEPGDRARRSLVRRAYLYLFVFLLVVGLMVAAGDLFYNLITHLLGSPVAGITQLVIERVLTVGAMAAFLVYHLRTLQQDARASQQALGSLHAAFPSLIIVQDEMALAEEIVRALNRQSPRLPVAVHALERGAPDDDMLTAKLIVLPANLAIDPPEVLDLWLSAYKGRRLILPQPREGWLWLGLTQRPTHETAEEAAGAIRQMAEGDAPRGGLPANPWSVAGYILGGLFALQILVALFAILVSSLFN
jgi:hypothetical protein